VIVLFWQSIRSYYNIYKGSNANSDDLRKVFEATSKQDLADFFQQWIYTAGQPTLDINWNYNKKKKEISITITQKQVHLFKFSLDINDRQSCFENNRNKRQDYNYIICLRCRSKLLEIDPKVNCYLPHHCMKENSYCLPS
jgi:hypothetical protein